MKYTINFFYFTDLRDTRAVEANDEISAICIAKNEAGIKEWVVESQGFRLEVMQTNEWRKSKNEQW